VILGNHKPSRKKKNLWVDTIKEPSVTILDDETPLKDKSPVIVPEEKEKSMQILSPLKSSQDEEAKSGGDEIT